MGIRGVSLCTFIVVVYVAAMMAVTPAFLFTAPVCLFVHYSCCAVVYNYTMKIVHIWQPASALLMKATREFGVDSAVILAGLPGFT